MRKPFEFKQFTILQEGVTLPVTTDACLFGAFVTFPTPKNILDIGSGTGLLSHFMHQKYPTASITGIDNHPATHSIAEKNAVLNQYPIQFLLQDLFQYKPIHTFDAIISNPPFFQNQLESPDLTRNAARHFQDQSFLQFFIKIDQLLSSDGTSWILLPASMETELDEMLVQTTLKLIQLIRVKPNPSKSPHLIFVCLTHNNLKEVHISEMIHRDDDYKLSKDFKQLLQPFYLDKALL